MLLHWPTVLVDFSLILSGQCAYKVGSWSYHHESLINFDSNWAKATLHPLFPLILCSWKDQKNSIIEVICNLIYLETLITTWRSATLLKFSEKNFLKENKGSDGIFENISFVEMESSKLINYSASMCWTGEGTMILEPSPLNGTQKRWGGCPKLMIFQLHFHWWLTIDTIYWTKGDTLSRRSCTRLPTSATNVLKHKLDIKHRSLHAMFMN